MQLKDKQLNLEITSSKEKIAGATIELSFYKPDTAPVSFYDLSIAGNSFIISNNLQISLGNSEKFNLESYNQALSAVAKIIKTNTSMEIINIILANDEKIINLFQNKEHYLEQTIFMILDKLYHFDNFKHKKITINLKQVNFVADHTELTKLTNQAIYLTESLWLVKDLANSPANLVTPTYLADTALAISQINDKMTVKILEQEQMADLGMNALLAVTRGSTEKPKLVIMEYLGGEQGQKPLVLVGKGITFDSGGISLKPGLNMNEMKYDMCGAATVAGVMKAITKLNLACNVIGIFASCENMPAGNATKPGDIITSMSGKTIEVDNTDAEGRLILCDTLTYVEQNYQPEAVIDIATLTGACIVALGSINSGMYANDQELADQLKLAARVSHDKIWQMPLDEEYLPMLTKSLPDLNNMGFPRGSAGSVTAAVFLAQFATSYKWAHLDIAGTAWSSGNYSGQDNNGGATGRPFYLLIDFIRNYKY